MTLNEFEDWFKIYEANVNIGRERVYTNSYGQSIAGPMSEFTLDEVRKWIAIFGTSNKHIAELLRPVGKYIEMVEDEADRAFLILKYSELLI